ADIFVLVVEAHVDFVQAAVLGAAFGEARPVVELLARRAAVAAAGKFNEARGRHCARVEPELEAAQFATVGRRLRERGRARKHRCERNRANKDVTSAHRADHSPNTNSIDAVELFLSSGYSVSSAGFCRAPASTATYCLPLIANVMGGARKAVPALKLHKSCSVLPS